MTVSYLTSSVTLSPVTLAKVLWQKAIDPFVLVQ